MDFLKNKSFMNYQLLIESYSFGTALSEQEIELLSLELETQIMNINISTEFFAKYVLLHSFAASKCKKGSNASAVGDGLSKLMRNIKMRQIS